MVSKRQLIRYGWVVVVVLVAVLGVGAYEYVFAATCIPMSFTDLKPDSQLVAENNAFAFKLYQTIRTDTKPNLFYSPYSISEVLAMLDNGAAGQTEVQISQAINSTLSHVQVNSGFQALNNDLARNAQFPAGTWCNANALWIDNSAVINGSFIDQVKNTYGANVQTADFQSNTKGVNDAINQWAANQTRGRIPNLSPSLTSDTRLVLVNAVYFKNVWETAFNRSETKDSAFRLIDGQSIPVPTMTTGRPISVQYFEDKHFEMIALPYKGDHVSMIILLPKDGQFDSVEANLDASQFDMAVSALSPTSAYVLLPYFQVRSELPLKSMLQQLGMTDAFDAQKADFSKILKAGSTPLYLGDALQKAFISIDESGSEAAAANVFSVIIGALPGSGPQTIAIDHPFIFAIRDQETGSILFLGRVLNPLQ